MDPVLTSVGRVPMTAWTSRWRVVRALGIFLFASAVSSFGVFTFAALTWAAIPDVTDTLLFLASTLVTAVVCFGLRC